MNTLLEHQHSKTLLVFHSAASFLKSPPSKRVKITQTFFFFLLFYIRRAATFHLPNDTSWVKESGRCMFGDWWLEISRLPLWQRPMCGVSAPSISRPRPVAEAGLNHLPDRHCHLSFGHLWYPVGNRSPPPPPLSLPRRAADAALRPHPGGHRTSAERQNAGLQVSSPIGPIPTSAKGCVCRAVLILCWTDAELCISKGAGGCIIGCGTRRGRRKGWGHPASPSCLSHSGGTLICFCHSIFCCNCENRTKKKKAQTGSCFVEHWPSTCDVTAPLMSVCVKSRHSDIWVLIFLLPVAHAAGLKKSSDVLVAMNGSQEPLRSRYGIQKRTCAPKPSK